MPKDHEVQNSNSHSFPPESESVPNTTNLEHRSREIEAKLNSDPKRPLPAINMHEVSLDHLQVLFTDHEIRTGDPDIESSFFVVQSPDQRNVGYAVIKKPQSDGGQKRYFYIRDIRILERGRGYGPAAYLEIMKSLPEGVGLRTEGVLSSDAVRLWEGFEAKGLARPSKKGGTPTAFETTF